MKGKDLVPTEEEFQGQVLQLARLRGWRAAHFRAGRTARGWRTPVGADGAGWPDLVLVRGRALVFAELKGPRGRLSGPQRDWLAALRATGAPAYVWTPADWAEIERVLA